MMQLRRRIADRDAQDRLRERQKRDPINDKTQTTEEILDEALKEFDERLKRDHDPGSIGRALAIGHD